MPSIACRFHVLTCVGCSWRFDAISCTVLSPRNASSATVALNLSEKFRRFVILVSIQSGWIHLSTLSEFAGPLQVRTIGLVTASIQDPHIGLMISMPRGGHYMPDRTIDQLLFRFLQQ